MKPMTVWKIQTTVFSNLFVTSLFVKPTDLVPHIPVIWSKNMKPLIKISIFKHDIALHENTSTNMHGVAKVGRQAVSKVRLPYICDASLYVWTNVIMAYKGRFQQAHWIGCSVP